MNNSEVDGESRQPLASNENPAPTLLVSWEGIHNACYSVRFWLLVILLTHLYEGGLSIGDVFHMKLPEFQDELHIDVSYVT